MYIVPIAWIYVALMMTVVEATNTNGTLLGAFFTFVFYGVLPVALMLYFMGTPARKRALRAQELREREAAIAAHAAHAAAASAAPTPTSAELAPPPDDNSLQPDAGGHAAADPVAPVAEKP